jgi:hypothetical protein
VFGYTLAAGCRVVESGTNTPAGTKWTTTHKRTTIRLKARIG